MSFFSDASLVYVPSAVKDAKTYSIKPTDGSGDLSFSRGSDIEATRVNANGYIEKAKVNLLYHSNNFTFTWTNTRTSEASGYAGYDGTNDAWALIGTAVDSTHLIVQNITLSAQVVTFSVYVKAGARDWCILRLDDGTPAYAYFDLSTGTKGTISGTYIDSTITSVGGGWYRLSVTRVATSGANVAVIYPAEADNDTTYLGDGATEDLYIQDSQINYGLVVQDYVDSPSGSATIEGITDNMPRLNYDPANPTCPSLLLEPSRTNLLAHSEYFGNATTTNATIESNQAISPEGVNNATKLVDNSSSGSHYFITSNVSTANTTIRTFTGYFKKGSLPAVQIRMRNAAGSFSYYLVDVDLTDGSVLLVQDYQVANTSNSVEEFGNGWYKITITASFTDAAVNLSRMEIYTHNGTSHSYTGDGTGYIYLYGLQKELGSYSSSYIPTYGSSATRTADSAYKTGISSLIGQTEGTIFLEFDATENTGQNMNLINFNNSLSASALIRKTADGRITGQVIAGGSSVFAINSIAVTGVTKAAFAYKSGDSVLYVNGTAYSNSSTFTFGAALSELRITASDAYFNFPHKFSANQALLFPTRLDNADLATLTTL